MPAKPSQAARRERRAERRAAPVEPQWVVSALAGVFLLSGGAGLVHEVVWARLLGHVFGATSLAIATVLAAYMGGLALGSWLAGRMLHRLGDGRRAYALLELGIGVGALLVPVLLVVVEPLYGVLWRRFQFSFTALSVVRFLLAGALLLGPTVLMGATLPILADYLAGLRGRRLAPQWLYTVNLLGAVLGVAAAGFVLMPALGLRGTIIAGAALNVGVGLAVLGFPSLARDRAAVKDTGPERVKPPPLLLVVALASGAISLATQVAWTRVLVLIVGSTTYAFSTVLLVYLVALAAGSVWASRRGEKLGDVLPALAVTHLGMALGLIAAVYLVNRLPFVYVRLFHAWQPASITGLVTMNTALIFGLLFVPVLFAGTILPLALIGALPRAARGTGAVVGTLYAVNTVGAIVGAVLGGFVLVPALGSQRLLLGVALAGAALGVVCALQDRGRRGLIGAAGGVAVLVAIGAWFRPEWEPKPLNAAVFEPGRLDDETDIRAPYDDVLYYREGVTATVVVLERAGVVRGLRINGRVNASDGPTDMPLQVLAAQLPIVLAPRAEEIFILGLGSGVTAGAALQSPARRVTVVELEPAVVEASHFFDHVNHEPLRDPRLRLYADDARHILLASTDTYDIMVSEPSHPWVSGVANLFTRDFFELAASRLREEGIFVQWLQGYQISVEAFRSILASFQAVFPEVMVYAPSVAADWMLVGSRRPLRFDLPALERRLADEKIRAEQARVDVLRPEHLLAGVYLGPERVRAITAGAPINTDDNMWVEFGAPRHMVRNALASTEDITEFLLRDETPLETMVTDPALLLQSRDRLEALIEGMANLGRDPARYKALLAKLG